MEASKDGAMRQSERNEIIKMNIKSSKLDMGCLRLALALERKRTTDSYGYHHYRRTHKEIVDYEHIDCCDFLNKPNQKITEIEKLLMTVESIGKSRLRH